MAYRADIDGLRTIAVLLVLVFHFDLFQIGKAGFIGVDVFFVISGFLITAIIHTDMEAGSFQIGTFLYRRVRRLYPALITVLLLSLVAGWFLFLPYRYSELASETLWSLLYVVNIYFWQNINYFGLQAGSVPLLHMWSLAVEEQFYLLFPFACLVIWRWSPRLLLPAVVLATLISFALGLVLTPSKPEASFYLLPTRAWELLIGSVLALSVHGKSPRGVWLSFVGLFGIALITLSVALYGPLTRIPGWYALLPTFGAAALILGGFNAEAPITRMLSLAPVVWIGKISYPLYLVHWPVRIFLQEHTLEFTLGWRCLGFVISFVLAAAIYYFVEKPVRQNFLLVTRRQYVGAIVILSCFVMGGSWLIGQSGGAETRFSQEVVKLLAFREDTPAEFKHCQFSSSQSTLDQLCKLGAANAPREVLVIGDSHAMAFAGAFDLLLANEAKGGVLAFHHGCMPILGAGDDNCRGVSEEYLHLAERTAEIKEVILVSIWRQALPTGGKPFDGRWVSEESVAEVFSAHLAKTVELLRAAGKEVTIIEPFFAAKRNVPKTLASNLAFGRNWSVDMDRAEHQATFETVFSAFDRVEGAQRISLIDPFCIQEICRAVVDGRPLFTDHNHLAFSHSQRIAENLVNLRQLN